MSASEHHKHFKLYASIIGGIGLLIIGGVIAKTYTDIKDIEKALSSTSEEIEANHKTILALETQNRELGGTLTDIEKKNSRLTKDLSSQKKKAREANEEATKYRKIATTDKQLLAKYSKVYFLNENYAPSDLEEIDTLYTLPAGKKISFHGLAFPYLEEILEDANEEGIPLRVVSGYRSFAEQKSLKSQYTVTYGAGTANNFSADQGYSEHQLGTTIDFTNPTLVGAVPAFGNSQTYAWLIKNAHKYGFILSYPQNNAYYMYEPWHWRFVGVKLATYLHEENKNFYDMDQREIDEYLLYLFD